MDSAKSVEIGAFELFPCITERSEKKDVSLERLRAIAKEATEQAGWGRVPVIHPVQKMMQLINNASITPIYLFSGEGVPIVNIERTNRAALLCFGPEGGFTHDEREQAQKNGCMAVSLGDQTLRAETAVVASLSLFLLGKTF